MAKQAEKKGTSPLVWIGGAALLGIGGYLAYDYFINPKSKPPTDTKPADTTPTPKPTPTPTTGGDLPDFSKWNIQWPLAPPIDSATLAKLANAKEVAFVIRLVQQRLMDLGYLKISATTGQFLDQTKQALIDFKVAKLGIPANTANIEKIGVATMQSLFNNSYAVYSTVYKELETFYKSKNETIPSGMKGLNAQNVGKRLITIKPTSVYIMSEGGVATPLDKVVPNLLLGTFVDEINGWTGFKPFEFDKVLYIASWAVKVE